MSSSPDSLTARGRATRQRLIDTARAELLHGGGTLEVAAVAEAAEVSPGLLYRYFGAKDGLVSAVVHDFYDSYNDAVLSAHMAPEADWATRERMRLAREIDFLCEEPMARIIVGRQLREPAAAAADAERLAEHIDLAARNVAYGQRIGQVPASIDARLAAAAFMGAFRELMAEALSREVVPSRKTLLDTIWGFGGSLGLAEVPESRSSQA
ncbi:TetR/AcrR family transcriptional regulator [Prescottella agglutinans]|nr:TetR/AcrR family transcriptional regulator [Prescottella agglutinans]